MSRLAGAALAVAAALAAGCGSGGGDGSVAAGASKAPGDALAFVSLKTDAGSGQWKRALALAARFPGLAPQLARLDRYRDAVGPETDLVWLDFANGGGDVVALTKPRSLARLKTSGSYRKLSGGWVALASRRELLDRFEHQSGGAKLDGDKSFRDGFGRLDRGAAVRAWVRGSTVQTAFDRALERGGAAPRITHDAGDLRALAASATAEPDGARIDVHGAIDPPPHPGTFSPSLAAAFPVGAELYVAAARLDDPTKLVLRMVGDSDPKFDRQLGQAESVLDISLRDDVYPLLRGESAFAVYRGPPVPRFLFLQTVSDERKADRLLRRISAVAQLSGGAKVAQEQVEETTVQALTFQNLGPEPVTIYDGVAAGRLFVTDARALVAPAVRGPRRALADDSRFRDARRRAHVPGKVAALAYGDLATGIPFVLDLVRRGGNAVAPATVANTRPLRSALFYLVAERGGLRMSGFTAIK